MLVGTGQGGDGAGGLQQKALVISQWGYWEEWPDGNEVAWPDLHVWDPFIAGALLVHPSPPQASLHLHGLLKPGPTREGRVGGSTLVSLPSTFLLSHVFASHLLCGAAQKITPAGVGT